MRKLDKKLWKINKRFERNLSKIRRNYIGSQRIISLKKFNVRIIWKWNQWAEKIYTKFIVGIREYYRIFKEKLLRLRASYPRFIRKTILNNEIISIIRVVNESNYEGLCKQNQYVISLSRKTDKWSFWK